MITRRHALYLWRVRAHNARPRELRPEPPPVRYVSRFIDILKVEDYFAAILKRRLPLRGPSGFSQTPSLIRPCLQEAAHSQGVSNGEEPRNPAPPLSGS